MPPDNSTDQRFALYARYYDLLYADKDYAGEAAYVAGLIRQRLPGATRILELGSGTGIWHGWASRSMALTSAIPWSRALRLARPRCRPSWQRT